MSSDGEGFTCTPADDARMLHLLPVSFTAGDEVGTMVQTILVETDLGEGTTARCVATVEGKPSP